MEDDEEFLSQIAAAEADALINSSKRRRINNTESHRVHIPSLSVSEAEGAYTAALKGSKSNLWQHQYTSTTVSSQGRGMKSVSSDNVFGNRQSAEGGLGNGNDTCFKCGKSGHWSRDCGATGTTGVGSDPLVPERACSCGLGTCLVFTANTEKNRGRKFYRCPVKQENGGCGFFEWCDNSTGANNTSSGSQNCSSASSFPNLPCPCGAGSCLTLTAKTGKNIGQQFYKCPANQENSCGYFKWCNDQTGPTQSAYNNTKTSSNIYETSSKGYGSANIGSPCFKCGKEGHWSRDCPVPSSNSTAANSKGVKSVSSGGGTGTCYKCGKAGHWARDCSSGQTTNVRQKW